MEPVTDDHDLYPELRTPSTLERVPDLARAAAAASWQAGRWAAETYVKAGKGTIGALTAPGHTVERVRRAADDAGRLAYEAIDATGIEQRLDGTPGASLVRLVKEMLPDPAFAQETVARPVAPSADGHLPLASTLRDSGAELLRQSRDVHYELEAHPAYARILSEIAPDEARILHLLLVDGPQAIVDVRTGGPMGLVRSHLVAGGLSMIGPLAGCRYQERVPSYLNNLYRLGLIWFSRETLRDHKRYQVLEAQPDVLAALHSVTAAKVVRRSVHLTPFGDDFCQVCFSDEEDVLNLLPQHSTPKPSEQTPRPPKERLR